MKRALKTVCLILVCCMAMFAGCSGSGTGDGIVSDPEETSKVTMTGTERAKYYLDAEGVVWGWGLDYAYAFGRPLEKNHEVAQPVKVADGAVDIVSVGSNGAAVLKSDGTLWRVGGWGTENGEGWNEGIVKIADNIAAVREVQIGNIAFTALTETGELLYYGSGYRPYFEGRDEDPRYLKAGVQWWGFRSVTDGVDALGPGIWGDLAAGYIGNEELIKAHRNVIPTFFIGSTLYGLYEFKDGRIEIAELLQDVKYICPGAALLNCVYIDTSDRLVEINKAYKTGETTEIKKSVVAKNVKDYVGGFNVNYMYLTDDGVLWGVGKCAEWFLGEPSGDKTVKLTDGVEKLYNDENANHRDGYFYILKKDGSVWTWGENYEICGTGSPNSDTYFSDKEYTDEQLDQMATVSPAVRLELPSAPIDFCWVAGTKLAVTKDGTYLWGRSLFGREYHLYSGGAADEAEAIIIDPSNFTRPSEKEILREDSYLSPTLWDEVFSKTDRAQED